MRFAAIAVALLGAGIGVTSRLRVLLRVVVLVLAITLIIALSHSHSFLDSLRIIVAAQILLQAGYFAGLVCRVFFTPRSTQAERFDRSRTPTAAR